eukprot:GHVP01014774.1.p1 GENE.GHVP01014774.1~~GHVP01014774.1.p1  ORF type:complete len:614 (-),score=149.50 GHVP01014774.1:1880-3721(-)
MRTFGLRNNLPLTDTNARWLAHVARVVPQGQPKQFVRPRLSAEVFFDNRWTIVSFEPIRFGSVVSGAIPPSDFFFKKFCENVLSKYPASKERRKSVINDSTEVEKLETKFSAVDRLLLFEESSEMSDDSENESKPRNEEFQTPIQKTDLPNRDFKNDSTSEKYWLSIFESISTLKGYFKDPPATPLCEFEERQKILGEDMSPQKIPRGGIHLWCLACDEKNKIKDVTKRYSQPYSEVIRRRNKINESWWSENIVVPCESESSPKDIKIDRLDDHDLERKARSEKIPVSKGKLRNHPFYAIESLLSSRQVIFPKNRSLGIISGEMVYSRQNVWVLKTKKQWENEGRTIKSDEQPFRQDKQKKLTKGPLGEVEIEFQIVDLYIEPQTTLTTFTDRNISSEISDTIPSDTRAGFVDVSKFRPSPEGTTHIRGDTEILTTLAKRSGVHFKKALVGWDFAGRGRPPKPNLDGIVVWQKEAQFMKTLLAEQQELVKRELKEKMEQTTMDLWKTLFRWVRSGADPPQKRKKGAALKLVNKVAVEVNSDQAKARQDEECLFSDNEKGPTEVDYSKFDLRNRFKEENEKPKGAFSYDWASYEMEDLDCFGEICDEEKSVSEE